MSAADPASIRSLGLSHRIVHALESAGIQKVHQLAALSPSQLKKIGGIGERSVAEIETRLADRRTQDSFPKASPSVSLVKRNTTPPETLKPPRRERHAESQKQLLTRALESLGRPTHVTDIVRRALELSPKARVPNSGRTLLILLQTDELITLGDGVFSLVAWEAARAREDRPVLPICPRPWGDLDAFYDQFFESVFTGREQLADGPTAREFVTRMLAWWRVNKGARLWVRHSIVAAYYLVGLLSPYVFLDSDDVRLRCDLPVLSVLDTRRHCLRALTTRLAGMPQFWRTFQVMGSVRPKELAEMFAPLHPYGLNDVEQRLYLLTALGAAERLPYGQYRLTALGQECAAQWAAPEAPSAPNTPPSAPAQAQLPAPPMPAVQPPHHLSSWPELWPDKLRDERSFMAFATRAVNSLARRPTTEQFLSDLLAWANRKSRKSPHYKQSILDACYFVGLINYVRYDPRRDQTLVAAVAPTLSGNALRDHCRQSALERLEQAPQLLLGLDGAPSVDAKRLAAKLSMAEEAVWNDVMLFKYLGLMTLGPPIRVLPAAAVWLSDDELPAPPAADGRQGIEAEDQAMPAVRLRACPALLPDRPGVDTSFLESLIYARSVLEMRVTTDEFLRRMITSAEREYPKSGAYYQNVLDAYYVVGLIPRTSYAASRNARLHCCLPADKSVPTLRDHCIRSALERLEKGPLLLEVAERLGTFTSHDIQLALETYFHDASYHIRLFVSLGLLVRTGTKYSLTPLASPFVNQSSIRHSVHSSSQSVHEPGPSWEGEGGVEAFAYLDLD